MAVIVLNGPPASGKDICCDYLKDNGYIHIEFKKQLFQDVIKYYGVDEEWFFEGYTREGKDQKEYLLKGKSRREALIHVSENIQKVKYGQDYYGFVAASGMDTDKNYCISDGGFVPELSHIINKFGKGDVQFIRLYRDGCNYLADSRRYIKFDLVLKEFVLGHASDTTLYQDQFFDDIVNVSGYIIHNNGNLPELYKSLEYIVRAHNDRKNAVKIGF